MTKRKYLVFLIQWLLGIRYGSPQVLIGRFLHCSIVHSHEYILRTYNQHNILFLARRILKMQTTLCYA